MGHIDIAGEALQEGGDEGDDKNAGADEAQRSHDGTGQSPELMADEGGDVDGDDAGGTLADGVVVHQLLLGGPAMLLPDHTLHPAQHGIAAAKAPRAHLGKGAVDFPKTQVD